MPYKRETAETLALQALGWLVQNEELLPVFLGSTGASEADLKARAGEADFLAAVLDFVMLDDAWVIAFCDAHTLPYDHLAQARMALAGGDEVHWT